MSDFAKEVSSKRTAKNLTQEQLANAAKIDRSYVAKIENGLRPSVKVAKKIGAELGIPWTIFFDSNCVENAQSEHDATSA